VLHTAVEVASARAADLEAFWPGRRGDAFDELCPAGPAA